ncbi:unnamed protein product [Bathycoccus prasinos]
MSQKRSEQKQRRKNKICFPFKLDISSRLTNDFDFLSIESGEFRYKLNDSNGDSYDLRYEYGDLGTHTFSCVHLSRMIWDLFELENNLEKVKKCVKDAFFAATRKRENNTSQVEFLPIYIPKRKEMQDGRKAEKPSRYRFIRAVVVDQNFGSPVVCGRSTSTPKYYGFAHDSAVPHRTGTNTRAENRYMVLVTWARCQLLESKNKQGKEVYTILNNLPQSDVLNTHQSWFEERFNVKLRPQN